MSPTVNHKKLEDLCARLLNKAGASENHAAITAKCLVDADLCGVDTHGVSRMEVYMKRLEAGGVNCGGSPRVIYEYPGAALIDGDGCLGQVTSIMAMEMAIEKAKTAGCYTVFVRNSSHYGMAAYYTRMAAEAGMAASTSTSAPSALAPWGSHKAFFGPDPISYAFPSPDGVPIVLDMAPSVVPRGRLMLAINNGETIPEGWAVDKEGNPTTDPKKAWEGTLLPIGGHKGAGLTMCLDILSGILPGAAFGPHIGSLFDDTGRTQNIGHVFTVYDPAMFAGKERFMSDIAALKAEVRELPRNPGVNEILLPGEIEARRKAERLEKGIPLSDKTYKMLLGLCEAHQMEADI
ncbi:MAG: Ldh family oxidoreductase [Clostridia bacterium]|nr:Ldh family oxidoreductase [Clostridia bacterium]